MGDDAALQPETIEQADKVVDRAIGRRVAAAFGIGKPRRRAEHMGLGVARFRRRRDLGGAGIVIRPRARFHHGLALIILAENFRDRRQPARRWGGIPPIRRLR